VFAGLKSIKNFGPSSLRFGPSILDALEPVLKVYKEVEVKIRVVAYQC